MEESRAAIKQAENKEIEGQLFDAIKIAERAHRERESARKILAEEIESTKKLRESLAQSDKKIKELQNKIEEFNSLNHHEGALLLSRCRDYTDSLRKQIEQTLVEARNERGQATNERQRADDLVLKANEKNLTVESKGKLVFDRIKKAEEDHKKTKEALDKECNLLSTRKEKLERDVEMLSSLADKKKKMIDDLEKFNFKPEKEKVK